MSAADDLASRFPLGIYLESDAKVRNYDDGWVNSDIEIMIANDSPVEFTQAITIGLGDLYLETLEGKQYESLLFRAIFLGHAESAKNLSLGIKLQTLYDDPLAPIPAWAVITKLSATLRWAEAATPKRIMLRTNLGVWTADFPQRTGRYSALNRIQGEDIITRVGARVTGSNTIAIELSASCKKNQPGLEYEYVATNTDRFDDASGTIELTIPQPMWAYSEDGYYSRPTIQLVSPRYPQILSIGPGKSTSGSVSLYTSSAIKPDYFLMREGGALIYFKTPQACLNGK